MEEIDRGYSSVDGFVCPDCIEEEALSQYIKDNATREKCRYCGRKTSVSLNKIILKIIEGLNSEYTDPVNGVGWSSRDGGWLDVEGRMWETDDLLHDRGIGEKPFEDIVSSIHQTQWVMKSPYGPEPHEELMATWDLFSKITKYSTRYFFSNPGSIDESDNLWGLNPEGVLDEIGSFVSDVGLVDTIPKGKTIYRMRPAEKGEKFTTAKDLGSPSNAKARSSRMSPAGIPMFYGAKDSNTCLMEVINPGKSSLRAAIAEWHTAKDLKFLNLTSMPTLPSIFDQGKRDKRTPIRFLNDFLLDFSKKIEKDDREHVGYVPTQIVSEYFRRVYGHKHGEHLHGIFYNSAQCDGVCCVVFCGQEGCASPADEIDDKCLLVLEPKSIKHKEFNVENGNG